MFKLLVLNDTIYENVEETIKTDWGEIQVLKLPESADKKKVVIDTLNYITDKYFYEEAKKRGDYRNMGEIKVDADAGDEDAQFLMGLYNAVWNAEETAEEEVNAMTEEQIDELLKDIPSYLIPKLEAAKQALEESLAEEDSTDE